MPLIEPQTLPENAQDACRAYALSETRRKPGMRTASAWLY